jgi:hypothetical protein
MSHPLMFANPTYTSTLAGGPLLLPIVHPDYNTSNTAYPHPGGNSSWMNYKPPLAKNMKAIHTSGNFSGFDETGGTCYGILKRNLNSDTIFAKDISNLKSLQFKATIKGQPFGLANILELPANMIKQIKLMSSSFLNKAKSTKSPMKSFKPTITPTVQHKSFKNTLMLTSSPPQIQAQVLQPTLIGPPLSTPPLVHANPLNLPFLQSQLFKTTKMSNKNTQSNKFMVPGSSAQPYAPPGLMMNIAQQQAVAQKPNHQTQKSTVAQWLANSSSKYSNNNTHSGHSGYNTQLTNPSQSGYYSNNNTHSNQGSYTTQSTNVGQSSYHSNQSTNANSTNVSSRRPPSRDSSSAVMLNMSSDTTDVNSAPVQRQKTTQTRKKTASAKGKRLLLKQKERL